MRMKCRQSKRGEVGEARDRVWPQERDGVSVKNGDAN